jgi:predicted acetyltransferase
MKISEWKNNKSENQSIIRLTKRVFGDQEIAQQSYFDWQYIQNPFGKAMISLAKEEEEVVGTNSIIPIDIWIERKLVKSSLACNVQVNPEYQNQGIFSKLLEVMDSIVTKNNISFLYAVPNGNSYNAFIKHNSTKIASLPLYVKILKPSKYFDSQLGKILKISDFIWKPKSCKNSKIESFKDKFSNEFEKILEKALERIPIIVNRSIEFLEWRYNHHPTRNYQTFILKEDNHIKGYIICRIANVNNKRVGVIEDFLVDAHTKNKNDLENLVDIAINHLYNNGASVIIATFNDKFLEGEILKKSGFFKAPKFLKPEPLNCIVMPFKKNKFIEKIKNYNNWFFSFGDYDVF